MNRVIFLDRDGTINKDYGYVYKKEDLTFLPGTLEGLKKLYNASYKLIIITNQSGVGRGYFSEEDMYEFNRYMIDELEKNGIIIEKIYSCIHSPEDNCECRKPKTKLFKDAIQEFDVDLPNSYAIGDKERDISISFETPIKGILINNEFENLNMIADYIIGRSEVK